MPGGLTLGFVMHLVVVYCKSILLSIPFIQNDGESKSCSLWNECVSVWTCSYEKLHQTTSRSVSTIKKRTTLQDIGVSRYQLATGWTQKRTIGTAYVIFSRRPELEGYYDELTCHTVQNFRATQSMAERDDSTVVLCQKRRWTCVLKSECDHWSLFGCWSTQYRKYNSGRLLWLCTDTLLMNWMKSRLPLPKMIIHSLHKWFNSRNKITSYKQ